MLALKDSDHVVRCSMYQLHRRANISQEEVKDAIGVLSSPDTKRLDPQPHGGRRIEKTDDGWLILNGALYEQEMRDVSRKFYKARWERNKRERIRKTEGKPPMASTMAERHAIANGEV